MRTFLHTLRLAVALVAALGLGHGGPVSAMPCTDCDDGGGGTGGVTTPAPQAKLRLLSLTVYATEDTFGADEAYLRRDGGRVIWGPVDMNTDAYPNSDADLEDVPLLPFTGKITLQLYDQDTGFLETDDYLGTVTVRADEAGTGEKRQEFREEGAHYVLAYEVIR
jgi:hypothetical protein